MKQHQTIEHKEIMGYPKKEREQIMSSGFRNVMRKDMFIQKETLHGHFKANPKMINTNKHGRIIFVICQCVFLIGFIVFFFLIM